MQKNDFEHIQGINHNCRCKQKFKEAKIRKGVKQGYPFSFYIFNMFIEYGIN